MTTNHPTNQPPNNDPQKTVYFTAAASRKAEVTAYAEQLATHGYRITSSWHSSIEPPTGVPESLASAFAQQHLAELAVTDMLIVLTEPEPLPGGGRHVELGYMLRMMDDRPNLFCLIIGPPEHIYHYHPTIHQFPTWAAAIHFLHGTNPPTPNQ